MDGNTYENTIESKKGWKALPIDWDNSPNRERFPKQAILTEKDGIITLTTDCSETHLYQCESQNLKNVNPGDTLRFSYDIEGEAQGLTLILRNKTLQRPLPGTIFPLQNGLNKKQDLQFIIPEGAKDISVLFYNDKIIDSKKLIISSLKLEKLEEIIENGRKSLPIDWDNSPNRERFPKKAIVKEENGKIILTTDCSGAHLFQRESKSLKDVNPGDTLRFSYDIEGKAQGLTLILRDKTHQRPIPGAFFTLQNGVNKKQDLQFIIPEGAKDISVLLYNEAIIPSATLTINELKIEKVEETKDLSPSLLNNSKLQNLIKNNQNNSNLIMEEKKNIDEKQLEHLSPQENNSKKEKKSLFYQAGKFVEKLQSIFSKPSKESNYIKFEEKNDQKINKNTTIQNIKTNSIPLNWEQIEKNIFPIDHKNEKLVGRFEIIKKYNHVLYHFR